MLSFTVFRDEVNLDTDLVIRALLGGTATLNYDYTATGFESIANGVMSIRIPANVNTKKIVCTPVAGLTQPDLTVTIDIIGNPLVLITDAAHPSAIGILTFAPTGAGDLPSGGGPSVSIDFAPGSLAQLNAGDGVFIIRVSIGSPQVADLAVRLSFSGTAPTSDYSVDGLDGNSTGIILAGSLYFDLRISPTRNSLDLSETIIVTTTQNSGYTIGQNSSITATILNSNPRLTIAFAPNSPSAVFPGETTLRVYNDPIQSLAPLSMVARFSVNTQLTEDLELNVTFTGAIDITDFAANSGLAIPSYLYGSVILPANSDYVDITFTPSQQSSHYAQTNYATAITIDYTYPVVTVVNSLPFALRCNRSLIVKRVGSPKQSGSSDIQYLRASNINYSSIPFIGASGTTDTPGIADFDYVPWASFPANNKAICTEFIRAFTNPDESFNAMYIVFYQEFLLEALVAKAASLNKRYLYLIHNVSADYFHPPAANSEDEQIRSYQARTSAEVSGSSMLSLPFVQSVPFVPELIAPYFRPGTTHKGYIDSQWIERATVTAVIATDKSYALFQTCLKIDTQNLDNILFIPSTPPVEQFSNTFTVTINPDAQTIHP